MPPPSKPAGKFTDEFHEVGPSTNLWVGNLSLDTSDSDLTNSFARFGTIDTVTRYPQRNYGFIIFKHLEDAKRAKESLQGTLVRGNPMRIQFSRPAKPNRHLWVGGVGPSVTKEQLEDEFSKFGKVDDLKFLRDRNCAIVDFVKLEDAVAALKNLNEKRFGGEQLRVDYLRSHSSKREYWSDSHDTRDGPFNNRNFNGPPESLWMPPDAMRNFHGSSQFGPMKHQPFPPFGGRREVPPSNVLWIGYPPSIQIDEQMLHNAMILFGEIERIKSFPSRHYSFVAFRSIDEARRAKEGLQGRLFNDPRITILFSSSDSAPGKDNSAFPLGVRGPRPDMFLGDSPFGRPMDFFGPNRPLGPNNFPRPLGPNAIPGPNMLRPFAPQGFDPHLSGPDYFNDFGGIPHNFPDVNNFNNPMAGGNWRRLSPPAPGMRPPIRPGLVPGTWDGFDANPFQRESKRSRIDGPLPVSDAPFDARMMDAHGVGDSFGFGPKLDRGPPGPLVNVQGPIHHSPVGPRVPGGDPRSHVEQPVGADDHCWRGIIAKGGTPVCHTRCIPVGKGIDSQLPEIVNCSARTGLDMLAKHCSEASGFDTVFFLPDSENDFPSYTEFLRYLGAKSRAGVAKLDDGTTLFLVPPSDFLRQVLNVSGPERLYGVVLKMPQQLNSVAMQQLPQPVLPPSSQYFERQQPSSLPQYYNQVPGEEDHALQMDYGRVLHDDSAAFQGAPKQIKHADEPSESQFAPQGYAGNSVIQQAGVTLTPELLATLAALIPANMQPPAPSNAQISLTSSVKSAFPAPVTLDNGMTSQGWRQEPQTSASSNVYHSGEEQASHPSQQSEHQFNQSPIPTRFPNFMHAPNVPAHSSQAQVATGSTQLQEPSVNMQLHASNMQQYASNMHQPAVNMQPPAMNMQPPAMNMHQPAIPIRPVNNFIIPPQGGQFTSPQFQPQYQVDASQDSQNNYGMVHSVDASGGFLPPNPPQPQLLASSDSSGVTQIGNVPQTQAGMPLITDKLNVDLPNQIQQLQPVLAGPGQGMPENEADKNQRYQSTLQFAANLLLQIQQQQQQQQANAQGVQSSGNPQ